MRKMLLSFRPDVYEKIKSGVKIFEHRRNFPDEPIMAYMYVSSPVKAITGVVYLGKRHCLSDWMEDYKEDSNAVTRIKEYIEKYHYRYAMEIVRNEDVRIIKSNSRYITISYDDKSKEIEKSRLEKYKVMVQTKCVVLKIKALWNSSENNLYGIDKKRAIKCIPDIENYEYVPVNNSMLAKAEIPFLIFERNRGKCFIEMY